MGRVVCSIYEIHQIYIVLYVSFLMKYVFPSFFCRTPKRSTRSMRFSRASSVACLERQVFWYCISNWIEISTKNRSLYTTYLLYNYKTLLHIPYRCTLWYFIWNSQKQLRIEVLLNTFSILFRKSKNKNIIKIVVFRTKIKREYAIVFRIYTKKYYIASIDDSYLTKILKMKSVDTTKTSWTFV